MPKVHPLMMENGTIPLLAFHANHKNNKANPALAKLPSHLKATSKLATRGTAKNMSDAYIMPNIKYIYKRHRPPIIEETARQNREKVLTYTSRRFNC